MTPYFPTSCQILSCKLEEDWYKMLGAKKINKASTFVKNEILGMEKRIFISQVLLTLLGYILITLVLNAIRSTASLWIVWPLIIIQILLYFLIFTICSLRAKTCGLKKFSFVIFTALAILGRINDWELFIIPLMIVIMLIVSTKNKNISQERQYILSDDS